MDPTDFGGSPRSPAPDVWGGDDLRRLKRLRGHVRGSREHVPIIHALHLGVQRGRLYNISSSTAPPVWNCGAVVCEEEVAYDALDKQVVYAMETSGGSEETWFFQSGTWTDVTSTANAVPTGLDEAMAWDGADGYVLDFSGLNLPASAWIYPGPLTASVVPEPAGGRCGSDPRPDRGRDRGTPAYTYSWPALPAGCSSSDSATISCQPTTVGATSAVVKVTDSSGGRSATSATLALTISPALTVATPNGSKPFSDVNEPISFGTSTTGGPGTYLTYSWTKVPLGCSSVNASALPCTPASPGTYPLSSRSPMGTTTPFRQRASPTRC